MTKKEMENKIAYFLCQKDESISCSNCFEINKTGNKACSGNKICRISEKTSEQLSYVLSSIEENIFLEACAGSGKTEVLALKTAYEFLKREFRNSGIAVLTFTNEATDTIKNRVKSFYKNKNNIYPHYIGTLSSFIHGYIAQKSNESIKNDNTIRLIDKNFQRFDDNFLKNYKVDIINKRKSIFAHNIYIDSNIKYIVYENNQKYNIEDYFEKFVFNKAFGDKENQFRKFKKELNEKKGNF